MEWQLLVFCLIFLAPIAIADAAPRLITVTPESGHIRVNKSTVVMCQSPLPITDCHFKIDNQETLDFHGGTSSPTTVVTDNGTTLYIARYAGEGLEKGHCGISLSHVAAGFYLIGCQFRAWKDSAHQEFMTLLVNDSRPLKLKVNMKYQRTEPGGDLVVLCSSVKKQKLDHCEIRLNPTGWVQFNQGHQSEETRRYHYHGRGLEKGDCGVTLLNATEADSGVVRCRVGAAASRTERGVIIKVASLKAATEILWEGGQTAAPGEELVAECVMKGVYPLPAMVWHYESELVKRSFADETPQNETTFRWPWEEHVMRQRFSRHVGNRLGVRRLLCTADESALQNEYLHFCPEHLDYNVTFISVRPECGLRVRTHYDTAYKREISKRDTGYTLYRVSKNGELVEGRDVKFVDNHVVGDALPKLWSMTNNADSQTATSIPPSGGSLDENVDDFEAAWDEVTEVVLKNGSVSIGPITYVEYNYNNSKPCLSNPGIGGGTPVLPSYDTATGTVLDGGDSNVEFESYPWHVGVYKKINDSYLQQCGATLVTDMHAVSAAHCFWSEQTLKPFLPDDYMVALGKVFRDWDRVDAMVQKRGVSKLHLHPSYRGRKRNFQYDIAVIEMSDRVVYTPRVSPACLDWDNDEKILEGSSGVVTGWGYTEDGHPSEILRYVELPYVDPNICHDNLHENFQTLLTTDKFCAGYSGRNTSVCGGDSGGGILFKDPLYGAHFLKGVVSISFKPPWFVGNCYISEATAFTRVSQSIPWLKRVLNYAGY